MAFLCLSNAVCIGRHTIKYRKCGGNQFDLPGWDGTAVFDSFQEQNVTIDELESRDYISSADPVLSWEIGAFNERIVVIDQLWQCFYLPTEMNLINLHLITK